ncbi:hypothetical protein SAMN05444166_3297 [Singulisphaera sp. GP187]|uniref:hypothetical protein n=1 Tax=Singulisphaera sp. GP187 TaxID=1882752 RepID=UPI00092964DE|nr:hypothetical protein [Singulisphaera sp. GP187]SIO25911.1 hypothetical protein SAMN05444166_3297 [Singulisphaera sp. GP187]
MSLLLWKLAESGDDDLIHRMSRMSFYSRPFSIRVVKSGESITLKAVELAGNVGDELGAISINRTRKLAPHHWDELIQRLEKAGYWELPTRAGDEGSDERPGLVFEGVSPGRYHVVIRYESDKNMFVGVCHYLVGLAGIEVAGLEPK